jgi:tetratricopeptide (TPR) repeat protein/CHAT domain-containing protein
MRRRSRSSFALRCAGVVLAIAMLAAGTPCALAQQPPDLAAIEKRYRDLYAAGRYGEALGEAQQYEQAVKARLGTNHARYATALHNLGNVHRLRGSYAEAEDFYKRALALREQLLGPDHADVAVTLVNLAVVYREQGRYGDGEQLLNRAVAIIQKAKGENHQDTAWALYNLGLLYWNQGRHGSAEPAFKRALAIYEAAQGAEHPNVAMTLVMLGRAQISQARPKDAEPHLQRALRIYEAKRGENHRDVARALVSLSIAYSNQGRYREIEPLLTRAIAIYEKNPTENQSSLAWALTNLANAYRIQSRYAEAEPLYRRALTLYENKRGGETDVAWTLNNLAILIRSQGRYQEAQPLFERALALFEAVKGASHADVAWTLNNLARVLEAQGRQVEAEPLLRRSLTIYEKGLGPGHPSVASTLTSIARVLRAQGRFGEAEPLLKRAVAIYRGSREENHPDHASAFSGLAIIYRIQGRYAEAEELLRRANAIYEAVYGSNHVDVAWTLQELASMFRIQGRHAEAEVLYGRALAIYEKLFGPNHPDVAWTLVGIGRTHESQGHYGDAEAPFRRALTIYESVPGISQGVIATVLTNLARVQWIQRRYGEAEPLLKRAVTLSERLRGESHPDVAWHLNTLGNMYRAQGRLREAEPLLKRAALINETTYGATHPETAWTYNNMAVFYARAGNQAEALAYSRKATAAILAHAQTAGLQQKERSGGFVEQRAYAFVRHVANLWAAGGRDLEPKSSLAEEAFEIAQWATHSATATAIQQMSTRFASGSGALAEAVRETQDLAASWRDTDNRLVEALAKPEAAQDGAALERLRKQLIEIEARMTAAALRLEREFPDYAALATPKPSTLKEVQTLVAADEALVFWLVGDQQSYVFAVTAADFAWRAVPLGAKDLGAKAAAFRRGLDVEDLQASIAAGRADLFDLGFAHDLYGTLLGPIESLIKDKRHLLLVPSGPLTGLPFHLLLTEKPAAAPPEPKDLNAYRDAPWLIKRHAVSVLPSVASLRALRVLAAKVDAQKPLIGFGDPVFRLAPQPERTEPGTARKGGATRVSAKTRGYADYWRGADTDPTLLGQSLPPLPDTADELRAVAKKLNAAAGDVLLGRAATESAVKRAPLADYRVIYFATHGLVAGDIKGLAEPSLALTLPREPTPQDDGLLTASEVAQLRLNADWVVLSACNTAAGETPGAEALSGLARAFFYAGARALLVSHWTVDSSAAVRLTTATFDHLKSAPGIGRAEALRRAMLAYLADKSDPQNAYPAYWAPFSLIGEGAAR